MYLANCLVIFPERARKVMLRFIVKFRDNASMRDRTFDGAKAK